MNTPLRRIPGVGKIWRHIWSLWEFVGWRICEDRIRRNYMTGTADSMAIRTAVCCMSTAVPCILPKRRTRIRKSANGGTGRMRPLRQKDKRVSRWKNFICWILTILWMGMILFFGAKCVRFLPTERPDCLSCSVLVLARIFRAFYRSAGRLDRKRSVLGAKSSPLFGLWRIGSAVVWGLPSFPLEPPHESRMGLDGRHALCGQR